MIWADIAQLAVVSAVVSWSVVQVIKPATKMTLRPVVHRVVMRTLSLAVGVLVGYAVHRDGWWGVLVGLGGGGLSTTIVAAVKAKIKGGESWSGLPKPGSNKSKS